MRCRMPGDGSWRIEIIGCKTPSGSTVPVNSTIVEGDDEWKCTLSNDGRVLMQQGVNAYAKCGIHNQGSSFHFYA
ncbi:unnamed protein product [Gongylonema pulchrum]|uniref:Plastocyanin-like domain-containing protein n=1 Tax=Gongylonema pulchrum TaxID=637853 RepID=A0A183EQU1_9BILA|nr:unnamed protein product [Gongylonema pulchrum]VDN42094.1 unnamed protein product [Gongylonema pulchrum]